MDNGQLIMMNVELVLMRGSCEFSGIKFSKRKFREILIFFKNYSSPEIYVYQT